MLSRRLGLRFFSLFSGASSYPSRPANRGKPLLALELLEDRTVPATNINTSFIYGVSDDGRFVLYTPNPSFSNFNTPQTIDLRLSDQMNSAASGDTSLAAIPNPLIAGNAQPTLSHD